MAYLKQKFTLLQQVDANTTKRLDCYQFDKFEVGKINLFPSKGKEYGITVQLFKDGCEYWRDLEDVLFTEAEHQHLAARLRTKQIAEKMEYLK